MKEKIEKFDYVIGERASGKTFLERELVKRMSKEELAEGLFPPEVKFPEYHKMKEEMLSGPSFGEYLKYFKPLPKLYYEYGIRYPEYEDGDYRFQTDDESAEIMRAVDALLTFKTDKELAQKTSILTVLIDWGYSFKEANGIIKQINTILETLLNKGRLGCYLDYLYDNYKEIEDFCNVLYDEYPYLNYVYRYEQK